MSLRPVKENNLVFKITHFNRLYEKERSIFSDRLDLPFKFDNEVFWKALSYIILPDKGNCGANRKLTEKDEIVQNDNEIVDILSKC